MRLIDADKLPWVDRVILVDNVDVGDIVIKVAPNYTSYVNDETPTVKAIPIEWIEKYANRFIELENKNYFAYRGLGDTGKAILSMLEEWEKENGK